MTAESICKPINPSPNDFVIPTGVSELSNTNFFVYVKSILKYRIYGKPNSRSKCIPVKISWRSNDLDLLIPSNTHLSKPYSALDPVTTHIFFIDKLSHPSYILLLRLYQLFHQSSLEIILSWSFESDIFIIKCFSRFNFFWSNNWFSYWCFIFYSLGLESLKYFLNFFQHFLCI